MTITQKLHGYDIPVTCSKCGTPNLKQEITDNARRGMDATELHSVWHYRYYECEQGHVVAVAR